jgi:hypothetical protein
MADQPQYEIDHGPPTTSRRAKPVPPAPDAPGASDLADEARVRAAIPGAQAQVAAAAHGVRYVDLGGLILIGLSAQSLGVLGQRDTWTTGVWLDLLLGLAGMATGAWVWMVTRAPGHELGSVPVPDVEPPKRSVPMTGTQRIALHKRRSDEVAHIDQLSDDFAARRRRLNLAVAGAISGSVCGWIIGAAGQAGGVPLCGCAGALAGFAVGWRIARGPGRGLADHDADPAEPWPQVVVERLLVGALPGAALLMALLVGGPILWSLGLWLVTAVIAFALRSRLIALAATWGLLVAPADDDIGAFTEDEDGESDDDEEEDPDAEAEEEEEEAE